MLWVTLPVFYGSPPVGVYVVGRRPLVFAEFVGGGKTDAAASINGVSRPPPAGRRNSASANSRGGKVRWQCRNCGAIIESEKAPEKCPVCAHPQAYFQRAAENF